MAQIAGRFAWVEPRRRLGAGAAVGPATSQEDARAKGLPFLSPGELSKALTAAKKTPDRAWLGEVSAVVLQQSLRDLDAAYRNFFDGLKGKRPKMGVPRFKSRKDTRQAIRFTANARWGGWCSAASRSPTAWSSSTVGALDHLDNQWDDVMHAMDNHGEVHEFHQYIVNRVGRRGPWRSSRWSESLC